MSTNPTHIGQPAGWREPAEDLDKVISEYYREQATKEIYEALQGEDDESRDWDLVDDVMSEIAVAQEDSAFLVRLSQLAARGEAQTTPHDYQRLCRRYLIARDLAVNRVVDTRAEQLRQEDEALIEGGIQ